MKKIKYVVLFVFALTMSVASCEKDESTSDKTLSTSEKEKQMLTEGSWTMTSNIENGVAVVIPDCEKDDVYTFSTNDTYSHNVGTVICSGETNSSGTWSLSLDLNFTFNGVPMGFNITNSRLALSQYNYNLDSEVYDIITEMIFIPR